MQQQQKQYRVIYEVHGQLLSQQMISTDPKALWPIAYFCRSCGDLWGRKITFENLPWTVRDILCEKCGDGSLLPWDFSFYYLLQYPRDVLRREIALFDPIKWRNR